MRQVHRAGEKLFVDYAGKKPYYVDAKTGEAIEVELFVAVLGASNYTYAEATHSQRGPDWIASHTRTFEFLGGVPEAVVCDQLKTGVAKSCRYEPDVQRTYEEMAIHYGTTVLPARPRSPKDKPKVEVAVQIAERWILARLRNETFFSLHALNVRIQELLAELNERIMRTYGRSRRQLFEELDRPALRSLPGVRFVYADWSRARVNVDYHVVHQHHYYSVPHALVHEEVELRVGAFTVEVFFRGHRVASHRRSYERGRHTTDSSHMPKAHQKHLQWSPSRLLRWAKKIGPNTGQLVEAILAERRHPEQGYRSCLGILRLAREYGPKRLEAAAKRALAIRSRSYRDVASILKNGLDRIPMIVPTTAGPRVVHENIRGPEYYM
jgi:transposase